MRGEKRAGVGRIAMTILMVSLTAIACGNQPEEVDTTRTGRQSLTLHQSRVLGFESPETDWSTSNGSPVSASSDSSEGTVALAISVQGYTEISSVQVEAPGSAKPEASFDIKLTQQLSWGDARLVAAIPSQGHYWRDLGGVDLSGVAPGVFRTLTFAVPADLQAALESEATDVSFKIIINAAAGTTLLVDRLVVSDTDGSSPGAPSSQGEHFAVRFPQGSLIEQYVVAATERVTIDARSTMGQASSLGRPRISNLGTELTFGADVTVHGDVLSTSDVTFLASQSRIHGDIASSGALISQDNVVVDGTVQTGAAIHSETREWVVEWPLNVTEDISRPPGAANVDIVPGAYDSVRIFSGAAVTLRTGAYFVHSLVVEPQAHVNVDTSDGPIVIYVKDTLRLNSSLDYIDGEPGEVLFAYLGQHAALFEEALVATVVAPNSKIELRRPDNGLPHQGAFFGREVHVFSDATVHYLPFLHPPLRVTPPPTTAPPRELPTPPREVGCYIGTLNGWQSTPCTPTDEVNVPLPDLGPMIQSVPANSSDPSTAIPFQFGQVETTFVTFGSVSDSLYGEDSLSVQLNTNNFPTPGGDEGVVQFVISKYAPQGTAVCIWRINRTVACEGIPEGNPCTNSDGYVRNCLGGGNNWLPARSSGHQQFDVATLAGATYTDSGGNPVLGFVTRMSWFDPTASDTGQGLYAVVTPDTLGLGQGWTEVSGTVLGLGDTSQANFTESSVLTRLLAGSCVNTTGPDPDIPWPGVCPDQPDLLPFTALGTAGITAETNNLLPVGGPSALASATKDLVYTQYLMSTSGICESGGQRLFVRDNPSDVGVVPSNAGGEPFWESPDIFVVPQGSAVSVDAVAAEALMTPGLSYDIYIRVHNDFGCAPITGAKALVYLADPAALSTSWQSVTGDQYVGGPDPLGVTVPAGGSALIGPISWTAPATDLGDGHKCLLASVLADDQVPPSSTFDAPGSFQVAQRNVQFSDCAYPLTNATNLNGVLSLTLSAEGGLPVLDGGNVMEWTFDDSDAAWFGAWSSGAGSAYAVSHANGLTTVRLGQRQVDLAPVSLAGGQSASAQGALILTQGTPTTALRIAARLVGPSGAPLLVQNGASCVAQGPPIVR